MFEHFIGVLKDWKCAKACLEFNRGTWSFGKPQGCLNCFKINWKEVHIRNIYLNFVVHLYIFGVFRRHLKLWMYIWRPFKILEVYKCIFGALEVNKGQFRAFRGIWNILKMFWALENYRFKFEYCKYYIEWIFL